jgi:plasmid stabilization system protein ParE
MYSLYVSPAAQSDIRAAFHWYESKRHGLGRESIANLRPVDSPNQTVSPFHAP